MKIIAVSCIDCRHTGKLEHELAELLGVNIGDIYVIKMAGGFGNLASLKGDRTKILLEDIDLVLRVSGAKKIVGSVHRSSESDPRGCAAYINAGFGEHFDDAEKSYAFAVSELLQARNSVQSWLQDRGSSDINEELVKVHFDGDGRNHLTVVS